MSNLIPSYLETDFNTLKARLQQLMSQSDTFKDFNYEGANITMLMELMAYIGDLNTFYNNVIARNVFPDTADIYEVVHSQVKHIGYEPNGGRSATVDIDVTLTKTIDGVDSFSIGDELLIPAGFTINTGLTDEDDNTIYYCTTKDYYYEVPSTSASDITFSVPFRQGEPEYIEYTGDDIVSNQIVLPFFQFDHEVYPYDEDVPAVALFVNDEEWERIPDGYSLTTSVNENDDVFMLRYDKYKRYIIEFSTFKNIPIDSDTIKVYLVKSLGRDGIVGANLITTTPDDSLIVGSEVTLPFLKNVTTDETIETEFYTITNSSASIGGSSPDTITDLKEGGTLALHSQKRNVNNLDYVSSLQSHSDIIKANVWGENEIDAGNTDHYNRVYISVIPYTFSDSTISTTTVNITDTEFTDGETETLVILDEYNLDWKINILEFIQARKYLCTDEVFLLPEILYFKFDIGLKLKRVYSYDNVRTDLLNKLDYLFGFDQRSFNEVIDFRTIHNDLLDTSIVSSTDNFENIVGINSLVFRDVVTYTYGNTNPLEIFPINSDYYPQFTIADYDSTTDNTLRPIEMGFNQFAQLRKDLCIVRNES